MIESQSSAMQNKLFDTKGEVENKDVTNYEFETIIYLNKIKKCTINDIANHLKIEESKVKTIVKKIEDRGVICINGEEISIIESNGIMNKFWRIIIYGGLPFSILGTAVCLCGFFPRINNLGLDYMGIIVGILTLLITLLVGWNIYSALSLEKRVNDLERIINNTGNKASVLEEKVNSIKREIDIVKKLRESTEEYAMGIAEAVQAGSLMNNPYETRFMQIYKCYTSAIMHFLRCNRDVSNHITTCLDNMKNILNHRKYVKENGGEYDDSIPDTEGFEEAINEIINSQSSEFTTKQRKWFISLEELRKQIIQP